MKGIDDILDGLLVSDSDSDSDSDSGEGSIG
jgi:hypothetical protein